MIDGISKSAFFDELEKISADIAHSISGTQSEVPTKPGEIKPPISPVKLKAKVINPATKKGLNTNYTRSNVEAPGTDISVGMNAKMAPPPPVRY